MSLLKILAINFLLEDSNGDIQAVIAPNDGTASGSLKAIEDYGINELVY